MIEFKLTVTLAPEVIDLLKSFVAFEKVLTQEPEDTDEPTPVEVPQGIEPEVEITTPIQDTPSPLTTTPIRKTRKRKTTLTEAEPPISNDVNQVLAEEQEQQNETPLIEEEIISPVEDSTPKQPQLTQEVLREIVQTKAQDGHRNAIRSILDFYNAKNVTLLDEDYFKEFYEKIKAL